MKKQLILSLITFATFNAISQTANWQATGSSYLYNNPSTSNVGIGTNNPLRKLEINGSAFVNAENNGFLIDAPGGGGRVGLMKYQGHEGVLSRVANQDFGITRTIGSNINDPTNLTYDMYFDSNGQVSIGNTNPQAQLNITTPNISRVGLLIDHNYTSPNSFAEYIRVKSIDTKALSIVRNDGSDYHAFTVMGNGKTIIGLKPAPAIHNDASLSVDGKIICRDFYVLSPIIWPDYVFAPDYKLTDLEEVKKYYQKNKHLPGVPNAKEIEEKGINITEISTIQMQKIEELTIYLVQLKEEVENLKKENELLKNKIK